MLDRGRVRDIFAEAALLPAEGRAAYLDNTCGSDPELRSEVESLLAAASRHPEFMGAAMSGGAPAAAVEAPGARIGVYKLLEQIGQGGFGSVYMAEQEMPVRRRVALKIIKLGMDTRAVISRFEAERQALAMMDHPHIARVLDAGATDSGRPYFVMELVNGEPITRFADAASLSVPQRLALFVQVCQAVQHAHNKGIIHRDIKPGNVLVSEQDGKPHAKVIDFGIAKATEQRLTEKTLFTEFRQLIGTPEYMSPEQAGGAPDVDTRSDVYSLGVLLYELLTGATPFDARELRSAAYDEIRRIIREVDPPKPSTRLSRSGSLPSLAAVRRTEPRRLSAEMTGDLDWIVMKALEKDRGRRYETASALCQDLERHLSGDPVTAAPPSMSYRARKFVRRHRAWVMTGSAVLAVLLLGVLGTTWGLLGARAAEKVSASERDRATAVRGFLEQTFQGISPQVALGRDTVLLGALMDQAAARLDAGEMKGDAGAERDLRLVIAGVYTDLARYEDATKVLSPLRGPTAELSDTERLRLELLTGRIGLLRNRFDEAQASLDAALASIELAPSPDPHVRAEALSMLGEVAANQTRFDASVDLHTRAVAAARSVAPLDQELLATCLSRLGGTLALMGQTDGAKRALDEVLTILSGPKWADSPLLIDAMLSHSMLLIDLRPQEAVTEVRRVLETARRVFPSPHPKIAMSLHQLGAALYYTSDLEGALACHQEALDMRTRLFGEESEEALESRAAKGSCLAQLGRHEEAIRHTRQTIALLAKGSPGGSYSEAHEHMMLATSLRAMDHFDDAVAEATRSMDQFRKFAPAGDPMVSACAHILSTYLREAHKLGESAELIRGVIGELRTQTPAPRLTIASVQYDLAELLVEMNTPAAEAEAQTVLRDCLGAQRQLLPDGNPSVRARYRTTALLGSVLVRQAGALSGEQRGTGLREAESLLIEAHNGLKGLPAEASLTTQTARTLTALYDLWESLEPGKGFAEKAARWRAAMTE